MSSGQPLIQERFDESDASFAFDIETVPNFPVLEELFEREIYFDPPFAEEPLKLGNAKKPETIARLTNDWEIAEAKRKAEYETEAARNARARAHEETENARYDEFVSKSLLKAERCKVLCISYCYPTLTGTNQFVVGLGGASEQELLDTLWVRCLDCQRRGGTIYTASGTQFDLRMCWRRSLILGLKIPCQTLNWYRGRAYPDESFVDVSEVFAGGDYGFRIRVDDLAAGFGLPRKTGNHGATFWKLAEEDRKSAEEYAKRDAEIAWRLGMKLRDAGVCVRRNKYSESY